MNRTQWAMIVLSVSLPVTMAFQNCGPLAKAPTQDPSAQTNTTNSSSTNAGSNSSAATEPGGQQTSAPGTIESPPAIPVLPSGFRVTLEEAPCLSDSDCVLTLAFSSPVTFTVSFDWRTSDSAYLTFPLFGQPGVNYVSKSGHTIFLPGETRQSITVRSLHFTLAMSIPLQFSNAKLGDAPASATILFGN